MTRVVVLPADETACGYYRLRLPAGAVRQIRPGWEIEVYRPRDVKLGGTQDNRLAMIYGIPDPKEIDLLVMQRIGTPLVFQLLRWAQENGIAVVLDADDAMWCIERENVAWGAWNGHNHWKVLDAAAELADVVTVTTPALERRYGKHGRAEVLPNCIPGDLEKMLETMRPDLDPNLTVGWAGYTGTHPGDLKVVGDAVLRASLIGSTIRVIGDADGASRDWLAPVEKIPSTPLGLPYFNALTSLDIGLVPLRDNPFNRAKSYLKALEYAAAGVAVIATPTPSNRELARSVSMELASTPEEWLAAIQKLSNDGLRAERVGEARRDVFESHTYESQAHRWASVWERALNRRAKMSA